jgi:hypothetical protein
VVLASTPRWHATARTRRSACSSHETPTATECATTPTFAKGGADSEDGDRDGTADFCDGCPVDNPDDSDSDGICDTDDICDGDDTEDDDADGTPDNCDVCSAGSDDDDDYDYDDGRRTSAIVKPWSATKAAVSSLPTVPRAAANRDTRRALAAVSMSTSALPAPTAATTTPTV